MFVLRARYSSCGTDSELECKPHFALSSENETDVACLVWACRNVDCTVSHRGQGKWPVIRGAVLGSAVTAFRTSAKLIQGKYVALVRDVLL